MTCSTGTKRSPSGRARKPGSSGGILTRAKRRSPRCGVAHHHGQVEREVGDVRERVARVDAERRQHREHLRLEHRLGVGDVGRARAKSSGTRRVPCCGQLRDQFLVVDP